MRAKLDESMPTEAGAVLLAAGWECDTVHDENLAGADDRAVALACSREGRVLFTLDLDFADIRAYPPTDYVGIVVFRPTPPSRRAVLSLLTQALKGLSAEWEPHQLWIVEPDRIRTRSLD